MELTCAGTHRPLPSELLGVVFQYLLPSDLLSCLVVSREWYTEAIPYLYSNAKFSRDTSPFAIQMYKTNKQYIRHMTWDVVSLPTVSEEDILDIALDYQVPTQAGDLDSHTAFKPGLRRPALRSFSFLGALNTITRFDGILFNLTSLTRLSINCWSRYNSDTLGPVSLGRILETMPHLIDLSVLSRNFEPLTPESPLLEPNAPLYQLRTFEFGEALLFCPEPMLQLFRRLGNLVDITIQSTGLVTPEFQSSRGPEVVSQALSTFCPKLQRIVCMGDMPFYLYKFPSSPTATAATGAGLTRAFMPLIRHHAKDREEDMLVEGQLREQFEEAFEYFPNVTTVITYISNNLTAEDMRCLAVRAKNLTYVDLSGPHRSTWDNRSQNPMIGSTGRHRASSLDLQIFLETCPRLKVFEASQGSIEFKNVLPRDAAILSDGTHELFDFECDNLEPRFAKPWACEETLETLKVGIGMMSATPWHHRVVFAQLGRCRRLKSLNLSPSNLIPTLKHGVDLLEGLKETLEEVAQLSTACTLDHKETLLWVLDTFKKLTKIGTYVYEDSTIQAQMMEWVPPEHRDRLGFIARTAIPRH